MKKRGKLLKTHNDKKDALKFGLVYKLQTEFL